MTTTISSIANDPEDALFLSKDDFLRLWYSELRHLTHWPSGFPPRVPDTAPGKFMGSVAGKDLYLDESRVVRSERTGRVVCPCGKGYANEQASSPHHGTCKICYQNGLTRRELKAKGLKRL